MIRLLLNEPSRRSDAICSSSTESMESSSSLVQVVMASSFQQCVRGSGPPDGFQPTASTEEVGVPDQTGTGGPSLSVAGADAGRARATGRARPISPMAVQILRPPAKAVSASDVSQDRLSELL